jgi:hypothetical protein
VPTNNAQPDLFWAAVDWAVRGAGAILLLILSIGWKDYRDRIKSINDLERQVAVLTAEVNNLKGRNHE